MAQELSPQHESRRGRPAWTGLLLAAIFLASALPVVVLQVHRGRMARDQLCYHEQVIRTFARQWPRLDFSDYLSATTPGFHAVVAAVSLVTSDSRIVLQLLGSGFTVGLIAMLGWAVARRAPPALTVALCAPMVASLYVWPSGVWLLPDNAGWWGVLAMTLISLHAPFNRFSLVAGGLTLMLLVFVRQIHLWTAAPLWAAAWLGPWTHADSPDSAPSEALLSDVPRRASHAGMAVVATGAGFGVAAYFLNLWNGLTPPSFQTRESGEIGYHGANLASPAFTLSVFAVLSAFFAAYVLPSLAQLWRDTRVWLIAAAAAGLVVSIVPATTFSQEHGRWTGLWNVVSIMPDLGGRTSPVIVLLSVAGAVLLMGWANALRWRDRWVVVAIFAAFIAAQTSSSQAWQRYVEPMFLMLLPLMAVRTREIAESPLAIIPLRDRALVRVGRWLGPLLLGGIFAVLTAASIVRSRPIDTSNLAEECAGHTDRVSDPLP
ncbi:MAG: hypothetical protein H6811_09060 [Phycisphaeraceae bacterium]|nr:hypothetical protein [Phycisphaeraceae bacterium]